eukprot:7329282-Pyramimonas_sp.AAC.1
MLCPPPLEALFERCSARSAGGNAGCRKLEGQLYLRSPPPKDPPRFDLQDGRKTSGTPAEAQREQPDTAGASQEIIE